MVVNACRSRKMTEGRRSSSWWSMSSWQFFNAHAQCDVQHTHTHTQAELYIDVCVIFSFSMCMHTDSIGVKF